MNQNMFVITMRSQKANAYFATARIRRMESYAKVDMRWNGGKAQEGLEIFLLTCNGIRAVHPRMQTAALRAEDIIYGIAAMDAKGMCACAGPAHGYETGFLSELVRLRMSFAPPMEEGLRRAREQMRTQQDIQDIPLEAPSADEEKAASIAKASPAPAATQAERMPATPMQYVHAKPMHAESAQTGATQTGATQTGAAQPGASQAGAAHKMPAAIEAKAKRPEPKQPLSMPAASTWHQPGMGQEKAEAHEHTWTKRPMRPDVQTNTLSMPSMQSIPQKTETPQIGMEQDCAGEITQIEAPNGLYPVISGQEPLDGAMPVPGWQHGEAGQERQPHNEGGKTWACPYGNEHGQPISCPYQKEIQASVQQRQAPGGETTKPAEQTEHAEQTPFYQMPGEARQAFVSTHMQTHLQPDSGMPTETAGKPNREGTTDAWLHSSGTPKSIGPQSGDIQPPAAHEDTHAQPDAAKPAMHTGNAAQRCENPFPNQFPGSSWMRIQQGEGAFYLEGRMRRGSEVILITAVPGRYSPLPPRNLPDFGRYINTRSGGFWVRMRKEE